MPIILIYIIYLHAFLGRKFINNMFIKNGKIFNDF